MTYLMTGGSGLVGAYTTRDLVRQGEKVVCYDIAPNTNLLERLMTPAELANVSVVRGDITDWSQLLHTLREHRVDSIVHMASLLRAAANTNFPLAFKVMCQGTNNVFEGAAVLGIRKVTWASSGSVFGPRSVAADGIIHNDTALDPMEPYGACKAFNEQMALHYIAKYDLDIIGLRFSLVYGYGRATAPGSGTGATYMIELVNKPALGLGPSTVIDGDTLMDWVYVEDVSRAVILASKANKPKSKAFIIHGYLRSRREAADYVRTLLPGTEITVKPGLAPDTSGSQGRALDGSAATEQLGFTAEHNMEEGLKRNINMLRKDSGLPPVG